MWSNSGYLNRIRVQEITLKHSHEVRVEERIKGGLESSTGWILNNEFHLPQVGA
jgi:hypothetical protein